MPVVQVRLVKGRSKEEKLRVMEGIREALTETFGIDESSVFIYLSEHDESQVLFPPGSPACTSVEVRCFPGRSREQKAAFHGAMKEKLAGLGLETQDILSVVCESDQADWAL